MNIYEKFLECSPEYKGMGEAKGITIRLPYYDFLKGIAHKYYELKAQQQEIQYDEEVVIKTAEELFGKGVITGVFSVHNGTHTYCNLNLGKTYLMSECEKSWFENIPEILIKSRRKIADPSTFPVDTLIEVKPSITWNNRHFAKYENGKVYFWVNGGTSKTRKCAEIAPEWRLPEEGE
jgi:hypothetical protein